MVLKENKKENHLKLKKKRKRSLLCAKQRFN